MGGSVIVGLLVVYIAPFKKLLDEMKDCQIMSLTFGLEQRDWD